MPLGLGARGDDVVSLTRRLRVEGFWKGQARRRYDTKVAAAVDAYARAKGQQATGRTNPIMVRETEGKLVVEKSKFKLTVYKDGKKISTYSVAIGAPSFPTPTGTYEILEMYKNPTWIPPNSPWAKGLEPIPPGPGNPLRHPLDRHVGAGHRLPRHAAGLVDRHRRLARLPPHAHPRRREALRAGRGRLDGGVQGLIPPGRRAVPTRRGGPSRRARVGRAGAGEAHADRPRLDAPHARAAARPRAATSAGSSATSSS